MKKLFLTSSFIDVAEYFEEFSGETLKGKKVTFIPTASKPEEITFYVDNDKKAFQRLGLIVDELDISVSSRQDIEDKLNRNDYIFISGGNTFYLLQELRNTGTDKLIVEQINKGKLYIGTSAGSIIVSPDIGYSAKMDDKAKAPDLTVYTALGVIDFYPVPHHTNEPFRKAAQEIINEFGNKIKLCPISNTQAIEVRGTSYRIIGKP